MPASSLVLSRVQTTVTALAAAPSNGISAASRNDSPPGRTMTITPARATSAAAQRRGPTFSLSRTAARAVTITGATKPIAVVVGTARRLKDMIAPSVETRLPRPRIACSPGRAARNAPRRAKSGSATRKNTT